MSLEIFCDDGETDVLWCDSSRTTYICVLNVFKVFADGDELKRALQITGLPQYGSAMKFYGETAKHIVGNWDN